VTATARTWTTWAVRYEARNGTQKVKEFATETARTAWIDKGVASGQVAKVIAYADPTI
jgi:aminoglycoside phosphotransferase